MIYYNQRNFSNIPYPSSAYPNATVSSGGCGVCCASMIVENLLNKSFGPSESAKFSIQSGARAASGTDMEKLSKALCGAFTLKCEGVSDITTAAKRISSGAMAIAHTKGGKQGLFSDSGHFVVLAEYKDNIFTVLDPYLYNGKFNTSARKGKVTQNGNLLYVSAQNVAADCKKYYIFEKKVEKMPIDVEKENKVIEAKRIIKDKAKLSDATIQFLYNYRYGDDLLIKLAEAMKQ